jgi:hypothetical protein
MSVFGFLAGIWNIPSVGELSRQVAQRSYALVRESVHGRTSTMSRAEALGYVRAKAAPVIRAEVRSLATRIPRLGERGLGTVFAMSSDRVVHSVLADINREKARQHESRRAA